MDKFYTSLKYITIVGQVCAAKMEKEFPPGSHKGRLGKIIAKQLQIKKIKKALVSSSGNFALSVAFYTQGLGIQIRVVTDVLSSPSLIDTLKKYSHVKIILINKPDQTGSHLQARLEYIAQVKKTEPGIYFIDQYNNRLLPIVYEETLAKEIYEQTNGEVSSVFMTCGTGATIKGLASYFRKHKPDAKIFAVDARGSNLFRQSKVKRKLPGYGNSKVTGLIKSAYGLIDYVAHTDDVEVIAMCHALKKEYNIWVGPSSGAAVIAFQKVTNCHPELIPDRGIPVLVFPDGGENYIETVYSNEWYKQNISTNIARFKNHLIENFQI